MYKYFDKFIVLQKRFNSLLKIFIILLKNPGRILSKINIDNLRFVFYILKIDGFFELLRFVNYNISKEELPQYFQKIDISANINGMEIMDYEPIIFKINNNPTVTIVIPVYNNFDYTYNCLKSIFNHSGDDIDYEIIIANDNSDDLTVYIEKIVHNVKIISNIENLKFLRNSNNAAKFSRGKYILFLNNDTQVQDNWLFPLVTLIEKDNYIGAVGAKLISENCLLQEAGGIIWNDASAWNYGRDKNPAMPEYNYVKEVDYISGAMIMVKKEIWERLGGFDEIYMPAYCEDSDICFSIRKLGFKVLYQPASVVVHMEGVSHGIDLLKGPKRYQVLNQQKLYDKWKDVLIAHHFKRGESVFWAREHCKRKCILVIDRYVPHYDKDAGSRTIYLYIKLFVKLNMKVIFLGENVFPDQPYTFVLQQLGVEVLYGDYYLYNWRNWLRNNGEFLDFILTCRSNVSIKYIDYLKVFTTAKIIYFNEDMQDLRLRREYEVKKDKSLLKSAKEIEKNERIMFNKADILFVVGTFEEKILKEKFPSKKIFNIPVYYYERNDMVSILPNERKNLLFVGGFKHSPNEDAVLWFYAHSFKQILNKFPDIIWYIVGSNPTEKVLSIQNKHIIVTGYITDDVLMNYYQNCRIFIAPLRYGAGVKGKIIEASYYKIPIITSSIGAEGLSLKENSFLINPTDNTFTQAVINLYEDYDKLDKLSSNCLNFINNYFSIENAIKVIEKVIL